MVHAQKHMECTGESRVFKTRLQITWLKDVQLWTLRLSNQKLTLQSKIHTFAEAFSTFGRLRSCDCPCNTIRQLKKQIPESFDIATNSSVINHVQPSHTCAGDLTSAYSLALARLSAYRADFLASSRR